MARDVEVVVTFPDGTPASGVRLVARNNNAANARVSVWRGITGGDGHHIWRNMDTGMAGDQYDIEGKLIDSDGVSWIGVHTERVFTPGPGAPPTLAIRLPLVQAFLDELRLPELSPAVVARMKADPDGVLVLARFDEMARAVQAKLLAAPITLATSAIEGLLRVLAVRAKVWREGWERETFGGLVAEIEIQRLLPPHLVDRLKGLNELRKPAAHHKRGNSLAAEGALAAGLAFELAVFCFS